MTVRKSLAERFWSKVDRTGGLDACWSWTAGLTRGGYGNIQVGGRRGHKVWAQRFAFMLANDADPGELHVLHTCDNPPCCNPAHLFLGTSADNHADMCAKGRACVGDKNGSRLHRECVQRGEDRWNATVTEAQVVQIRRAHRAGVPLSDIAREHDIDPHNVRRIVTRETWRHVKD